MKILSTPITVLTHFEQNTPPHPISFKLDDKEIRIEQVVSVTEEKLAGNKMLCFRCQSEIGGELKPFEIKFELDWKVVYVENVRIQIRTKVVNETTFVFYSVNSCLS